MKLRILSLISICLLTPGYAFSQWVQTNGPYGSINASAFITYDSLKLVATKCGLFSSENINSRWDLEKSIDISAYARKGDSLFITGSYGRLALIDMSQPGFNPVPFDYISEGINALVNTDSCLFAGTSQGGFYKSIGFTDIWQQYNQGLPTDTGYIPPKFGGGFYLIRHIYSLAKNSQYIFAGTRKGIYRTNPDSMIWKSVNAGLPVTEVPLIKNIGNTIYICINKTIYKSQNNGASWELVYITASEIMSICEIENILYITTKGSGIFQSPDNGNNWDLFNNGLDDLNVNFIEITDNVLICGTSGKGFYYYEQGNWRQNNSGIICSTIGSIVTDGNSLIANDYNEVYISDSGCNWNKITPDVSYELFGSMASMGDTVFLSVEYDTPSWPYDGPFILYTYDKGVTWNELNNPVPFARDDPYGIYCYGNRLYAFEDELMSYTDNLGSTWTEINLPDQYCNYFYDFLVFNSTPYAGACGNSELVKLNENEEWILSNAGLPDDRPLSGLAYCEGALFAYVDVYGMYVSMDNGNTWTPGNSGLDIEYGYGIRSFVPYRNSLFITTVKGIYYTDDYGQKWHSINSGLVNTNTSAITLFNDTLFVGTYGSGIWKCAVNSIPLSVSDIKPNERLIMIYPNPASEFIRILTDRVSNSFIISIYDLAGRKVLSGMTENNEFDISELNEGTYIVSIITDKEQTSGKLIIRR